MFATHSVFSSPAPKRLSGSGQKYWRAVSLPYLRPWLITTYAEGPEADEIFTLCYAWDLEFVEQFRSLADKNLVDVLCVVPSWQRDELRWQVRSASSIWSGARDGREAFVFVGQDGEEFCCGIHGEKPQDIVGRQLVMYFGGSRFVGHPQASARREDS